MWEEGGRRGGLWAVWGRVVKSCSLAGCGEFKIEMVAARIFPFQLKLTTLAFFKYCPIKMIIAVDMEETQDQNGHSQGIFFKIQYKNPFALIYHNHL